MHQVGAVAFGAVVLPGLASGRAAISGSRPRPARQQRTGEAILRRAGSQVIAAPGTL